MKSMKQTNLFGISPEDVVVLMVDFQNDFCHADSYRINDKVANEATARRANAFALEASQLGASVVYSQQVMAPEALTARQLRWDEKDSVCPKGSWNAEFYVQPVPGSAVVTKNRFDIWRSSEFLAYVEEKRPEGFVICGFELCGCILFAVLGADERGYRYVVPQNLVSGIDTGESTYNRAVRDYLRYVHDSSGSILDEWRSANNRVERTRTSRTNELSVVHTEMNPNDQLLEAAQYGDLDLARQALKVGADVDARPRGGTALWWACQEGHFEIVKFLVSRGADVNVYDDHGFTPLLQAVGEDHPNIVAFLIESGARVNATSRADGNSAPLHTACAYGYAECTRVLLSHGADPTLKDGEGKTPAAYARMYGHQDLADMVDKWSARPRAEGDAATRAPDS